MTTTDHDQALQMCRALPGYAQKAGGKAAARCPAHDDGVSSLSIDTGTSGKLLLKCHAGCTFEQIIAALGISPRAAMPPDPHAGTVYEYTDPQGVPWYRKIRHGKHRRQAFGWQHTTDGGAWWSRGRGDAPAYMYRLATWHQNPDAVVYLCEGEKDADAVAALGLNATATGYGAGTKPDPDHVHQLGQVRQVVILADADAPGAQWASRWATALTPERCDVVGPIVFGPMGSKADVYAWLAADPARDMVALESHVADAVHRTTPAAAAVIARATWRNGLATTGDTMRPRHSANNWALILANDPHWADRWRHDTRTDTQLLDGHEVTDADVSALGMWLEAEYTEGRSVELTALERAVDSVCRAAPCNRLYDALCAQRHDGRARAHTWLTTYLGVPDTPYSRAVGAAWLVSAVRRARDPGCRADHMLVLEGEQGARKSTALRTLAGDLWFTDDLGHLGGDGKAAAERLQGKWICEVAELSGMSRAEVEDVKAFVTRRADRYRAPYARRAVDRPRSCVMAGTTNEDRYLQDSTGNRRFWPVVVGKIDLDGLARDRDQLWAEVVAMEAAGAPSWLSTTAAQADATAEQDQRRLDDPWEQIISRKWPPHLRRASLFVTTAEVLQAVGISSADRIGKREEMRAGRVLRALGGVRCRRRTADGLIWGYKWEQVGTAENEVQSVPAPFVPTYPTTTTERSEGKQVVSADASKQPQVPGKCWPPDQVGTAGTADPDLSGPWDDEGLGV